MQKISFKLEVFEGPMDLLLSLISKHKLNIYDIEISSLLEQYLAYLDQCREQDLELAGEFLEMAARLIYIKTASLLPRPEEAQKDINSPGGSVYAGLGIYDTMQFISSDVATICTGMAASMAAVLLVAGAEGKRSALPHSRVMIHQPMGGAQGQASDIEITAREIQKLKKELYTIIADHSHTDFDKVWADSDRDYWMTAQEAKEYGMIDEVLIKK